MASRGGLAARRADRRAIYTPAATREGPGRRAGPPRGASVLFIRQKRRPHAEGAEREIYPSVAGGRRRDVDALALLDPQPHVRRALPARADRSQGRAGWLRIPLQ